MSTVCWKLFRSLLSEAQRRFRQQDGNELLPHVECQSAFGVGSLGASDRGGIAGRLQTVLPLMAALKQIAKAHIKLLALIQVVGGEKLRAEYGNELGIEVKSRIGPEIRGDFLGLILQHEGPLRLQAHGCGPKPDPPPDPA